MANEIETFLSEKGIPFERYEFPWRLEEETARLKAEELTIPEEIIFKTLVVKGNKSGATIALVPLTAHLDYKKLAKATGNRKIGFPPMEYVLEATGYPHGANTPIGIFLHHPEYPLVFDERIRQFKEILVSSGEIGHSVKVAVSDLLALLQPLVIDILSEKTK
ncbi:YbaK/EbsC family protein [Enterococcus sp. JM9B]|uniref:YbaK/EbsC family protein n=1 Tax=Enterococcus sp. JM9B TaxID=1857216 RepID=UPI00137514BD|nr:YbaK/EbsC family protein [Enterococcus sp. JM9B]KAF1302975.1 EbsC protein [Enterococcus sp. JM9B]